MSKETLKKKSGAANNTILDIANALRGEAPIIDPDNGEVGVSDNHTESVPTETFRGTVSDETIINKTDSDELSVLLKALKAKNYSCKEVMYVDKEVKEVMYLLKIKGKIPISSLVSYILEGWIIEHQELISSIIKNDNNRFI